MNTKKLYFRTVQDVREFVWAMGKIPKDVKVISSNSADINAKSLLGMLSLNLSETIEIQYPKQCEKEMEMYCQKWIVNI